MIVNCNLCSCISSVQICSLTNKKCIGSTQIVNTEMPRQATAMKLLHKSKGKGIISVSRTPAQQLFRP